MDGNDVQPCSKASLLGLGTDLLLMIVELLPTCDIKSLCLVSSYFHCTAKDGLFRNLRLDLIDEAFYKWKQCLKKPNSSGIPSEMGPVEMDFLQTEQRLSWLEKNDLLPAVRSLEVSGISSRINRAADVRGDGQAWERAELDKRTDLICRCIPQMTGLKHVIWHGAAVPYEILAALHSCPNVKLSIISTDSHEYSPLQRLKACPNLHALDIQHSFVDAEECLVVTRPLREILLTCPNLKKLRLNIGLPSSGCVVHGQPVEYHGIGLHGGERPPPLEELHIDEYPFGDKAPDPSGFEIWGLGNYEGYPADMEELRYWEETFDWSQLRKLGCSRIGFVSSLMAKLSASPLEEISVEWGRDDDEPAYMSLPTTLKAIKVDRFAGITLAGITRQGRTLQRLRIHQTEFYDDKWNNDSIDRVSLREIREHCPKIEELELDIARHGDWPYATLDILAGFPRLHTLTLWFELGIRQGHDPTTPYLNFSAAAKLFKYIHSRNPHIQKLILHSGAPPGLGHGLYRWHAHWPQENSTTFKCILSSRDDEAPKGIFTTSCTKLSEAENYILRDLLAQYPEGAVPLGGELGRSRKGRRGRKSRRNCKVAWEGPMSKEQWEHEVADEFMTTMPEEEDEPISEDLGWWKSLRTKLSAIR